MSPSLSLIAIVAIVAAVTLATLLAWVLVQLHLIYQLPLDNPSSFKKGLDAGEISRSKIRVACIGDSITHGHAGGDYISIAKELLGKKATNYAFINAGVNSRHAYNALLHVDEVIDCEPDVVTVLIGTNDCHADFSPRVKKRAVRQQKLPREPTQAVFKEDLTAIVARLQENTRATIGLFTLPTIGEDPSDPAFHRATVYSSIIEAVARETGAILIPLHEEMVAQLQERPSRPRFTHSWHELLMAWGVLLPRLGVGLDKIARAIGFRYHVDFLHLSTAGATLVAGLLVDFVEKATEGTGARV